MEDLHKRYKGYKDQIVFLTVYTREAHPIEGREWHEGRRNPARGTWEFDVKQPTTLGQRCDVAKQFCSVLKPSMPLVVDDLDDKVMHAYQAVPQKISIVDQSGRMAYQGGFGFLPDESEQTIIMLLLERGVDLKPKEPGS